MNVANTPAYVLQIMAAMVTAAPDKRLMILKKQILAQEKRLEPQLLHVDQLVIATKLPLRLALALDPKRVTGLTQLCTLCT